MNTLIRRLKKRVLAKKGELLVETVMSFFILAVLLLAVITTIQAAFNMLNTSVQKAEKTQEEVVNPAMLVLYSDGIRTDMNFIFSINGDYKTATHTVYFDEANIIAFSPLEGE